MKSPFFSVVIPAYNAAKFIRNTLDSVRSQTFNDYEIIVVNDGSCDDTLQELTRYFSDFSGLKHEVVNQENKGIGAARNSGVKQAKGEFIAFLDADDNWYKDKLSEVKNYLEKNFDIDMVCHDEHLVENDKILKDIIYGPYTFYKDLLFKGNCISTSATVVRREKLLESGLFSENLDFNSVEDYDLWLRLSKICNIGYLHQILGVYTVYDSSITKKDMHKHMQHSLNVLEQHFNQWDNKSMYYKYMMNKRRAEVIRATAFAYLNLGKISPAWILLQKSLRLNPFSLKAGATVGLLLLKCLIK